MKTDQRETKQGYNKCVRFGAQKAPHHVISEAREILTITNILVFSMEIATGKYSSFNNKVAG